MNTPNKLTLLRILLIPVFMFFLTRDSIPYNYLYALVIFVIASLTDMLDGQLARKHNLITDFGKIIDPLADKLLMMSAMVMLIELDIVAGWIVVIILSREFIVTSLRLLAKGKSRIIAADIFGKIKTILQVIWIVFELLRHGLMHNGPELARNWPRILERGDLLSVILVYAVLVITVLSGINYIIKSKDLIFRIDA